MKKCWSFISGIGCYPDIAFEEIRRLQLMNRLNFITFVVLFIYIIIELFLQVYLFIPGLVLMLFLVLVTFMLLYKRKYSLAKNYATIIIAGCISFFVLATGEAFSEALFIPLSVMPLIVFRNKKTSVFYLFFIISIAIVLKIIQPSVTPLIILDDQLMQLFRIMNLVNGIAITYFITYYFKGSNENYEARLVTMNEMMTEKNKEITDSINYAKHIQSAILPSVSSFNKAFRDSFVLFKPKDIVAGDFYWLHTMNEKVFFAAADCTGHGVPGAMVSVICSNALNRAVKELGIDQPGQILDKATELVVESFSNGMDEVKDGMDISFACLNKQKNELLWAGANNPLWILRNRELIELKPDKQPIGRADFRKPFTTQSISVQQGDMIFLFTDGFADQFGGERGKKFKYSKFKELLKDISGKECQEQLPLIDKELSEWKGNLEQVDDILVIGIRI
jgi:serine phosphatase RsbU (regulator of sigma subunit)